MIETLASLQPIILLVMLIVMYSLELIRPYLAKPVNKKQHDIQNIILTFISFFINGAVGAGVVTVLMFTDKHQAGLLNFLHIPSSIKIIAGILLIDFGSYCIHNLQHKIPFLWKLHSIHHSDLNLNTTSSLRFHPLDVILSQGLYPCIIIPLLGISITSFVIYGTIAIPLLIIQHADVELPAWIEKYGRLIFSTPGWHKIHHSDEQQFTDSHYGDVFTFWDRIFGTWHKVQPHQINYGLKEFAENKKQKAGYLLKSPFIKKQ